MLSFLRKLLRPAHSSFVIQEVDHMRRVVVLEDKLLNLRVEVLIGDKSLRDVKIIEPYAVLLTYADGSKVKKRILK